MYQNRLYDPEEILRLNPYPGRGILIGLTPGGAPLIAYFIMGRSGNSRNRVFVRDGLEVIIEPHDPARVEDPSLIIYRPLRALGERLIISNGDHTDTIHGAMAAGRGFEEALRGRRFEPDHPNHTPRISGLLEPGGSYRLSILRAADAEGLRCERFTFEYEGTPGEGHLIHTYLGPGQPLPPFCGEPARVRVPEDLPAFADSLWQALDQDNRVALLLRGRDSLYIHNRHARRST